MDTTAEEITFDANGVCSFCHYFDRELKPILERAHTGEGKKVLEHIVHGCPEETIIDIALLFLACTKSAMLQIAQVQAKQVKVENLLAVP